MTVAMSCHRHLSRDATGDVAILTPPLDILEMAGASGGVQLVLEMAEMLKACSSKFAATTSF